jgi:hypothetical protein
MNINKHRKIYVKQTFVKGFVVGYVLQGATVSPAKFTHRNFIQASTYRHFFCKLK